MIEMGSARLTVLARNPLNSAMTMAPFISFAFDSLQKKIAEKCVIVCMIPVCSSINAKTSIICNTASVIRWNLTQIWMIYISKFNKEHVCWSMTSQNNQIVDALSRKEAVFWPNRLYRIPKRSNKFAPQPMFNSKFSDQQEPVLFIECS